MGLYQQLQMHMLSTILMVLCLMLGLLGWPHWLVGIFSWEQMIFVLLDSVSFLSTQTAGGISRGLVGILASLAYSVKTCTKLFTYSLSFTPFASNVCVGGSSTQQLGCLFVLIAVIWQVSAANCITVIDMSVYPFCFKPSCQASWPYIHRIPGSKSPC